jgi:hypothetical protein
MAAIRPIADEEGYVAGPDADRVCAELPKHVAQIIACGTDSPVPTEVWDMAVPLTAIEDALRRGASDQGFELVDTPED